MIRLLLLILVGTITFAIIYFINHPNIFDDVWIYFVGLAGAVIQFFKMLWKKILHLGNDVDSFLKKTPQQNKRSIPPVIISSNEAVG